MAYECENCGMDFETTAQLSNHKAKFCISSKYGNYDALDKRMEELNRIEHDLNYARPNPRNPAGPTSIRNAGQEIMGIKNVPSSAKSARSVAQPQTVKIVAPGD